MPGQMPVKKRVLVFLAMVLLWQLVILGKVFYLKVFRSDYYELQARAQRNDIVRVPATRGRILDCRLETLAASVPFDSVYVYTPEVEDKGRTARALAEALGLDAHQILMKMDGQLKFRYIKRFITPAEARQVKALNLDGVGLLAENRRIFPNGRLASHVLGTVTLANDSEAGLEGIEKVYDRHLAGQPGELFIQKDGKSNVLTTSILNPPQSGQTLILNIDSQIQHIAERELLAGIEKYQAAAGMVVIMEPQTGHILALANYPDFDPNSLKGTPLSNLRNLAVERYFEPGSTFKIVTAAAALEEGLTTPEEIIYCGNGFISISGHIIRDHKPFQNLSFNEVIANSSDVGAIKLGLRLGEVLFHRYICAFGFGERTTVDLPAEEPGYIRKPSSWSGISIGAVSMGQEVGVTGVQMARAMAAIANGGYLVRPMVVDRILDENGQLVQHFEPEKIRILAGRTAEILHTALVMTVEGGTARKAGVPGYSIAGKTGTAQKFDSEARSYSKTDFVASFIGFAPADRPQFVAAVIFDSPHPLYHGGDVSAPVFAEIARNIFLQKKIQPSTPIPELAAGSPSPAPPATVPAAAPTPAEDSLLAMDEGQRETVMNLIPEGSFTMPDFTGKSLRVVLKECARMGLVLQPSGSGVAVEQIPPAGALIKPASRCTVWFSTDIQKVSTFLRSGGTPGPDTAKNILSRNSSQ
jgi:cell division protein FtsI (penicillin-binding protein 3)